MASRDFSALFAADVEPTREDFTVQGKPCFVELRKMDFGARSQYDTLGVKVNQQGEILEMDGERRALFLVSRTVTKCQLWQRQRTKDGTQGDWQQFVTPDGNRRKVQEFLEHNLVLDGEFGKWLHDLCMKENGLDKETEGNSSASSPS